MKTIIKLDLEQEGLEVVFKDYVAKIIEKFWEDPEQEYNSRMMFEHINRALHPQTISRASIINSMNWLVELGVLSYRERTGKGGYHRVYKIAMNEEELWNWVITQTFEKLGEASGIGVMSWSTYQKLPKEEEEDVNPKLDDFIKVEE